ncbi:MAG: FmdE, Molybdenum formylmethanofuran dehydrogenase operon [Methanoregula sp. PtaU1.Bin051]|nr:MAG: FmdE, Molybdenum formylmethanofuran dehydrogenase operon [Methanoregula sp. PtaU1.Bin051]
MTPGSPRTPYHELTARLDSCNVPPQLKDQILKCAQFHTSPAPGVLIGAFMVDYAMELLGLTADEKLFGVCETPKCLPDALQVIARCTTGNNRLKVVPIGKFAITLNAATNGFTADAIRVYVDLKKLKKFPIIDMWYANSPDYDKKTMDGKLQTEIFRAGRKILSSERVRIRVAGKRKWKPVTCPGCGETVPDYLIEGDHCGACGSMKYYETIG